MSDSVRPGMLVFLVLAVRSVSDKIFCIAPGCLSARACPLQVNPTSCRWLTGLFPSGQPVEIRFQVKQILADAVVQFEGYLPTLFVLRAADL
jgi:hypothetical protein